MSSNDSESNNTDKNNDVPNTNSSTTTSTAAAGDGGTVGSTGTNTTASLLNKPTSLKRSSSELLSRSTSIGGSSGTTGGTGGIDNHPYTRGSVIEVIYGMKRMEDSDMEEDFEDVIVTTNKHDDDSNNNNENKKEVKEKEEVGNKEETNNNNQYENKDFEVRLADIIDRCPSDTPNHENPAYRYKYYIHYRDYNRRMDEWITDPQRIVSPPSVGNAKVREMKKALAKAAKEEEEKKAREKLLLETSSYHSEDVGNNDNNNNDNQSPSPGGRTTSQRVSSRRAIAAITNNNNNGISIDTTGGDKHLKTEDGNSNNNVSFPSSNISSSAVADESDQSRLTRRQRRKSARGSGDNDDSNNNGTTDQVEKTLLSSSRSDAVVTTFIPGEDDIKDKVVTVAARELDEHEGLDEQSLREHEEVTKVKNVSEVQLGKYRMNAWYFSPIPKELFQSGNSVEVLYVCEFTLNFFARKEELLRFQAKTLPRNQRHPPGNEIYRNENLSMFEIDGFEERLYCQNLCYIAKLFLDHKTLYFDVDPFLFYVLCEVDERGFHPVGYYSKEKYSDVGFNLACILTFPCHQRKGYGRFLIDFSYELSKKEEKVGSPEKPSK